MIPLAYEKQKQSQPSQLPPQQEGGDRAAPLGDCKGVFEARLP